jgi:transcriptional regulator with XRE-family HTH domain
MGLSAARAFAEAERRGWSMKVLAGRAGLNLRTLYTLKEGTRQPGPKTIPALLRAFPGAKFEDLFEEVPDVPPESR